MASRASRGRKQAKKAVQLTLMVVGGSGTGRTTFLNTLTGQPLLPHRTDALLADPSNPASQLDPASVQRDAAEAHVEQPLSIKETALELEEDGVRVALTVIDTPGFGDSINNDSCFSQIKDYLESQLDVVLAEENRIKRNPRFKDSRVHALLYFIPPTGHALREMDIELMRKLSPRVNVIPVIGKADSLTPMELHAFKKRIMEDIAHYNIPVYNFPYDVEEDDDETIQDNSELRSLLPFAIVGSEEEIMVNGEAIRGRRYPWGIVEVDNPQHSDFTRLRQALMVTHLSDLKEITHVYLYENYRTEKLSHAVNGDKIDPDASILPEDMANQSVRIKEEHLRREEAKLRDVELKMQRDIELRRQELMAKEDSLKVLEARLASQGREGSVGP